MQFTWFVPTTGDGEYIGNLELWSPHDASYATFVSRIAEEGGIDSLLFPVGSNNLDPWITATNVASHTKKIKLIVAVRPNNQQPLVVAQMARTLNQIANGRVCLNIVTGGFHQELIKYGDFISEKLERYERTKEFSLILSQLWEKDRVNFQGKYYSLSGANVVPKEGKNRIVSYISGNSNEAMEIASQYYDYFLYGGEKIANTVAMATKLKEIGKRSGSTVKPAVTYDLVIRETKEKAWEAAHKLVSRVSRQQKIRLSFYYREQLAKGNMLFQNLMNNNYMIEENIWAGLIKARLGASACLVGDYITVADTFKRLIESGIDNFFVRGYPYKDELERFTSHVLPKVRRG